MTKTNFLQNTAINYFFTRVCNYECKFCFHTKKSSHLLNRDDQFKLLQILKDAGAEKMNFAGGEPFLFEEILGQMVKTSKEIGYSSVSIISNGSKIKRKWFEEYAYWLDIMGTSCDTIDPKINYEHGRCIAGAAKARDETQKFRNIASWCREFNVMFKINTVVTAKNKNDHMSQFVNELDPMRWKVFQVLPMGEENIVNGVNKIKDLDISADEFNAYVERNRAGLNKPDILIPEDNKTMRNSYILIDEYGRFLDCSSGSKIPTRSILEVGIEEAWNDLVGFDKPMFDNRGGYYPETWTKSFNNKNDKI